VSTRVEDFMGTPKRPLDAAGMKEKFMLNTKRFPQAQMERMFERLQNIENEPNLDWLTA
jgi:2-methylcitrate dehydratase PrpD